MLNGHKLKYFPQWAQFVKIGRPPPHVPPKCSDPMARRITTITNLSFSYIIQNLSKGNYTYRGARVVQWWEHLISSHHCGPGSNPGVNTACGLSLLLVLSFASRGYSSGTPVFPSSQKPSFSNFHSTRKSSRWRTT